MTTHQSNLIFYTAISIFITATIIHVTRPDFFGDLVRSEEELLLKEAIKNGDDNRALTYYQRIIDKRISDGEEINAETAEIYEEMAKLQVSLGNTTEAKNSYLSSLSIKEQLDRNDVFALANTYYQLGAMAEEQQEYDRALAYFEQSLATRLGDKTAPENTDDGFTNKMHKSRLNYIRLNNEGTINTLNKLAAIHMTKREHSVARAYYERALAVSKQVFGESGSETRQIIHSLNQSIGVRY